MRARRSAQQATAVGRFLYRFSWKWWVTLTYRSDERRPSVVQRHVRHWLVAVARQTRGHFRTAVSIEEHRSGALHVHLLLGGGPEQSPDIVKYWTHGNADAERFVVGGGAPSYLAKFGTWGIWNACPRLARCRRAGGCVAVDTEVPIA